MVFGRIKTIFPKRGSAIASIDREEYLNGCLVKIKKFDNVDILIGAKIEILSADEVNVNNEIVRCRYLVGADGYTSAVRIFLGLISKKMGIGLAYLAPQKFERFKVIFDKDLFGSGYAWIFPKDKFTSIGCGADLKSISGAVLRKNFDKWLQGININVSDLQVRAATLNYDYQGYKFGDVYLIGDVAGLISGLTGKGMFGAMISAKQVAKEILEKNHGPNLIKNWIKRKRRQELLLKLFMKKYLRLIAVPLLLIGLRIYDYKQLRPVE